jgi:hypothetical protein
MPVKIAIAIAILLLLALLFLLSPLGTLTQETSVSRVTWESRNGHNKIQLRGNTYEQEDVKNLLPGGHGSFDS